MESERKVLNSPDGAQMVYYVSGRPDGRPVVVMHGWGCNHSTVKVVEDSLSATHRVYNVDFPGFGESPEPPAGWGVEEYTRLIMLLIEKERLERPSLAGHSFGGRVAIMAASSNPDRFEKIILIDAAGIKPRRTLRYYLKVYRHKLLKRVVLFFRGREKGAEIIARMQSRHGSADYRNSSPAMRAVMSKVVNEDLTSLLPLIKAPTLLIWGENDTATPLSDARRMEAAIADSGLVVFEGCGHYSFLDNPGRFRAVMASFMSS